MMYIFAFLSLSWIICFNVFALDSNGYSTTAKTSLSCPELCNCTKVKNGLFRVRCTNRIVSLRDIDLASIGPHISQLDLSRNLFDDIGSGAFINFTNLKKLDLSNNRITTLKKESFEGLRNLDVLKLSHNAVTKIDKGTFDHLTGLKKLDVSNCTFQCDCSQFWLVEWAHNMSVKLSPMPKCLSPPQFSGFLLSQLPCDLNTQSFDMLKIHPQKDQVVFEGDTLRLQCEAPKTDVDSLSLSWFWGSQEPSNVFHEIHIKTEYVPESKLLQSSLTIDHLSHGHAGQWNCLLLSDQTNHSRTVSVVVLSGNTQYCPQTVSRDNKGIYAWPQTVVGSTAELPCEVSQYKSHNLLAVQECGLDRRWHNLNTSACPFASETTRLLQEFSLMNLTKDHGPAILESAQRLHRISTIPLHMNDKMDAIFISKAISNYLNFLATEKELGTLLIDMISATMLIPRNELRAAQEEDATCSKLVHSVEIVGQHTHSLQLEKSNLAVEEFQVSHKSSLDILCIWYSGRNKEDGVNTHQSRLFHCTSGNNSVALPNKDKMIEASVQMPASLFHQLETQGMPVLPTHQLLVAMYENSHLFPHTPSNHTYGQLDVVSCVVGTKLVGVRVFNLSEPLLVILPAPLTLKSGGSAKPVWWDEELNGGLGGWSQHGCKISQFIQGMLVLQCDRFGYFSLLEEIPYRHEKRTSRGLLELSHPAIFAGSFTVIVSLLIAIVTYIAAGPSIQMPQRTKHSLVNTWIAISLLCFMFCIGVHQTEDVELCQSIGLVLHYLTLSTLLWMAITVSNMRKQLRRHSLDLGSEDELPQSSSSSPPQKPLLGLYLVGWGVGLMVVGVSGAVNLKQYRYLVEDEYCFLAPNPALGAVLVPCCAVLVYLLVCVLLVRCDISQHRADTNAQLSDGTQGTENVDLELLECVAPVSPGARSVSVGSGGAPGSSSETEDTQHTPATQLRAAIIVLLLFLSMWAAGALSTAYQLHSLLPHAEVIFCSLYAFTSSLLAVFVLFFHCFARSDVRSCWQSLKSKKTSVPGPHVGEHVDHQPPRRTPNHVGSLPVVEKVANIERNIITSAPMPVTNCMSSSTSINTTKSQNLKDAVELNKTTDGSSPTALPEPMKMSNLHMLPLHRSHQSIADPEVFYNARQSDMARKFFRKQRRQTAFQHNQLRACQGGATRSDLEHTLRDSLKGSRSKVSNTNIHVEDQDDPPSNRSYNLNILAGEEAPAALAPIERWVIGADRSTQINNDTLRSGSTPVTVSTLVSQYDHHLTDVSNLSGGGTLKSVSSHQSRGTNTHLVENASSSRTGKMKNNIVPRSSETNSNWGSKSVTSNRKCVKESSDLYHEALGSRYDTSSAVSEVSLPVSYTSQGGCDTQSDNHSNRHGVHSPHSRRHDKREQHYHVSHPTSLASSALSFHSKDSSICNGHGSPAEDSDIGSTGDGDNDSYISKKETCV